MTTNNMYHICYQSQGKSETRVEYAINEELAEKQAREYFNNFGYGDESIEHIIEY